jgi:hypothetical protein
MLEKLLGEIRKGGTLPPPVLAKRLNISLGMVEMMLEDLERRGLLERMDPACVSTCGSCQVADFCTPKNSRSTRLWKLK